MTVFDVYNGDADGICALLQLRLAQPQPEAVQVTGVKRDIALLERVDAVAGDQITVLDISLDKNRQPLLRLLENGAEVSYFDHHFSGEIPEHPSLAARINTQPDVCTSMLVNRHLKGQFIHWAIVGTLGDNLDRSAQELAKSADISASDLARLRSLGICINYNAYGGSLEDLHFTPTDLYQRLCQHASPLDFLKHDAETFDRLKTGYDEDLNNARQATLLLDEPHAAVLMLPEAAWARRVSGVFGNELANQFPDRAHGVVSRGAKGLTISVRAPLNNRTGADEICRQFETGGGRKAAAGINRLPDSELDRFIQTLSSYYQPQGPSA